MQNFVLHRKLYHLNKIDESEYSSEAYKRYEKLRLYSKLRSEGCSERSALEAIGMSRATYFRWLKKYKTSTRMICLNSRYMDGYLQRQRRQQPEEEI